MFNPSKFFYDTKIINNTIIIDSVKIACNILLKLFFLINHIIIINNKNNTNGVSVIFYIIFRNIDVPQKNI